MAKNSTLNLSALAVTDAEMPKTQRQSKAADSPFVGWLQESYDNGFTGKAVTVPAANVKEVVYLIRAAANYLNIGSRVVVDENSPRKGQSTVKFAAKQRKQRKQDNETAAE